ncbi:MAG: glycosyl transferase [Myxococcales bacterium]|nr:glycosyl transferase [Myxococcales bacterium]
MALTHDQWRQKNALYYKEQTQLLKHLIPPGLKVLELGCATGDTLAALNPSVGVGVDFSGQMLEKARLKYPHLRFEKMNAETLDLGEETFDVVVLADLVGELRDLWAAFRALRKICHPETRIVISYYNFFWQPALELAQSIGFKRPQYIQNWFTIGDITNLLRLNGFTKVSHGDKLLCPLAVPMIGNLLNRYAAGLPGIHHLNLLQYVVARPGPDFHVQPEPLSTTVLIPAKNERGNIRPAIRRTPKMGPKTEIIFVEGGSEDGTREEILRAMEEEDSPCDIRFVPQTGKGKGDAVMSGFAQATGDVLMILDADLTVMPEDLPRFYMALAEGRGEFINGCRLVYPMEDEAMRHLNLIANKLFGIAFSYVLSQPLKDTLCGTKVLRRSDYNKIHRQRDMFGAKDPFGDFDLLFGASQLGLQIAEMPVRYKARRYGSTQIHRFRHGLMLGKMLWRGYKHFKIDI